MKNFITKHIKPICFTFIVVVLIVIFTTAGVAVPSVVGDLSIDDIKTCSVPVGKIVAKGIDVSRYQGDIDFKKVKDDGYSFVIIRLGTSMGGKDSSFETNYKNAVAAGLDVGCYFYTYGNTAAELRQEAKEVVSYIDGKEFSYPVFLDFEHADLLKYTRVDENTDMITAFCEYMKRSGYYPGVYTSNWIYHNYFDYITLADKWDFWVASYIDNTPNSERFAKSFSMWQYTSNGGVNGIDARVDLNVAYVDYPEIIKEFKHQYKQLRT